MSEATQKDLNSMNKQKASSYCNLKKSCYHDILCLLVQQINTLEIETNEMKNVQSCAVRMSVACLFRFILL